MLNKTNIIGSGNRTDVAAANLSHNKSKTGWFRIFGAALIFLAVVAAILGVMIGLVFRTELIIELGIVVTEMLSIAFYISGGIFGIAGIGFLVRAGMLIASEAKKLPAPVPAFSSLSDEQRDDPAFILRELIAIQPQKPNLQGEIADAINCLQQADSKQSRIHELQQLNPRRNLDQVVKTIDDAEIAIAKNSTKILNMLTIWDPNEALRPDKAQIYGMNRDYIHTNLQRNRHILDQIDLLLHNIVKYVDSSGAEDSMSANIESLNEALVGLLKQYEAVGELISSKK
ncbi:MAG: hypothetical protein LBG97_04695 [Coriobacteriales bacterium]|jgi:hypothetical protein|nr:hypothetical protein [Coriobacteriales bacterium]